MDTTNQNNESLATQSDTPDPGPDPTPRQLANRRNALKSTGPRTDAGKAISKMNAKKHGVLAKTVVMCGYHARESSSQFKKLCRAHYEYLQPVGPVEEMLVDQIVTCSWRLRRAHLAEAGEIAVGVDGGSRSGNQHKSLPMLSYLAQGAFPVLEFSATSTGCYYITRCLRKVRASVERAGELTETTLNELSPTLKNAGLPFHSKLAKLRAAFLANPEQLEPHILRARHQEAVLKYLNQEIHQYDEKYDQHEIRENVEESTHHSAAMLPPAENLEKILRYETAIQRDLFRALNQLERLQRQRRGEPIPPPLQVEMTSAA